LFFAAVLCAKHFQFPSRTKETKKLKMLLLTKLLPIFVYPIGLTICLVILSLLLQWLGRRKTAVCTALLSILLLWGASTTVVADIVLNSLEKNYPPRTAESMETADAIVVLGGVTRGTVPGIGLTDFDGGVDRVIHAARLFKAGKAPLLILTGGNAAGLQPESEAMAEFAAFMGVSADKMVLESASRNTWQNGANCKRIFEEQGIKKILLVTSAYHIRRAEAVFEHFGVAVIPAATDYQLVEGEATILDWLPSASALDTTTKGIKEYLGWWVFSLQGFWR
jgi:uncharacterized SAM-binding protein YcdF (DUF218 family)